MNRSRNFLFRQKSSRYPVSQNFRCRVTSVKRRLTADIICRIENAIVHLFIVMEFAELGYPANSQVFTGVSILTLNSAKNCELRLRIHNLQLHKSRSSEQRLQHVQHQPSHQARMVFWVYLGSQSYQRGAGGGREREEMALPLSLSCM